MAEALSHIAGFVRLIKLLPSGQIAAATGKSHPSPTRALAEYLGLSPTSINFGKIILWISVFANDGHDAINRSSLNEQDRKAALALFDDLSSPFRYPFAGGSMRDFQNKMLTSERQSYMSLLDAYVRKEYPIYLPDPADISNTIDRLRRCSEEFSSLELPDYLKDDFLNSIDLYIIVAEKLPMVAHRLVSEESSNLLRWLFSSIPENAKATVARSAVVINMLVAVFVAPSEASEAASSYYNWYSGLSVSQNAIDSAFSPKALPAPVVETLVKPSQSSAIVKKDDK